MKTPFLKKLFRISTIPMSLNLLLNGQLRYLNQFYEVTAISGSGEDMEVVRAREGVKIKEIEMQRGISPLKDLKTLIQLYRYFNKEKPDIVHSITPKAGLLSMTAARWAGVPVRMHTFTGLIFPSKTGFLKQVLIIMDRVLTRNATHIFPEGQGVRKDLIQYRITRKPLPIIANGNVNGIDTAFFNKDAANSTVNTVLKKQLGISEGDFVFVFVGRLVQDKGISELVNAFEVLSELQPTIESAGECKLLLVGPVEEGHDMLSAATLNQMEQNPAIIAAGYRSDVRPYLAISDALVFPSYREGFPNVVLQAGSMGLPSIVTDINGCNEIIEDSKNGLIIPVKDTEALIQAMKRLMTDENLYHNLCVNARPNIVAKYKQHTVWEAILNEYSKALQ